MDTTHLMFALVIIVPALVFVAIIWLLAQRQMRVHERMLHKKTERTLAQWAAVPHGVDEHKGTEPASHTDEESAAKVMDHIAERSSGTRP